MTTKGLNQRALCHSKKNLREAKVEGVDEEGGEVEVMEVVVVARNQIHSRSSVDRPFFLHANEVVFYSDRRSFSILELHDIFYTYHYPTQVMLCFRQPFVNNSIL